MRLFFFFNDTATTEIYTLSLHDALPISSAAQASFHACRSSSSSPLSRSLRGLGRSCQLDGGVPLQRPGGAGASFSSLRSEEHTSELQSQSNLVCRLLLDKKNI